jgi:hypothetical protein
MAKGYDGDDGGEVCGFRRCVEENARAFQECQWRPLTSPLFGGLSLGDSAPPVWLVTNSEAGTTVCSTNGE